MSILFFILTVVFIIVSTIMVLIVLVQRPQGGGLAGAFGGAGGGGTDTVFGGRVGDALTVMTCVAFAAYLLLALGLNMLPVRNTATAATPATQPAVTDSAGNTIPVTPTILPPTTAPASAAPTGQQDAPAATVTQTPNATAVPPAAAENETGKKPDPAVTPISPNATPNAEPNDSKPVTPSTPPANPPGNGE